jgi:predicted DNA-binding transcriptional regulator AlpA
MTRYLSCKEVTARYGVSRTTVQRWIDERGFPRPVHFTDAPRGRIGWLETELDAYDAKRQSLRQQTLDTAL